MFGFHKDLVLGHDCQQGLWGISIGQSSNQALVARYFLELDFVRKGLGGLGGERSSALQAT